MGFTYERVRIHKRSAIPHWDVASGVYFVTFRTVDSLPRSAVLRIESERKSLIAALKERSSISPQRVAWIDSLMRRRVDDYLDEGHGECPFAKQEVAAMMARTLEHFNGDRYLLLTWCVMPNHIHVIFELAPDNSLEVVVHSWKSFSSKEANRILGSHGEFWQGDYFDRTIRNRRELENTVQYVLENPSKAGLRDWPWVKAYDEVIAQFF